MNLSIQMASADNVKVMIIMYLHLEGRGSSFSHTTLLQLVTLEVHIPV